MGISIMYTKYPIMIIAGMAMITGVCCMNGCGRASLTAAEYDASPQGIDDRIAAQEYDAEIKEMFLNNRFKELDERADAFRASKERQTNSVLWKLTAVYEALAYVDGAGEMDEAGWELRVGKFRQWIKEEPRSMTARVGLAYILLHYAWGVKGGGAPGSLSKEKMDKYHSLFDESRKVLTEAQKLPTQCPEWYMIMLYVGLGQEWSLDQYDAVFNEAVAFEPDYFSYYDAKARYLLPAWYGKEGDWERYADEISRKTGGKKGPVIYWYICMQVKDYYDESRYFQDTKVSWEKMKEGYRNSEGLYGVNARDMNSFCLMACLAKDKQTAKGTFDYLAKNKYVVRGVWGNKQKYSRLKAWAFTE
jgi:hypothetical protein